jgi:hypothetical protein
MNWTINPPRVQQSWLETIFAGRGQQAQPAWDRHIARRPAVIDLDRVISQRTLGAETKDGANWRDAWRERVEARA